jgi:hypothetical protein
MRQTSDNGENNMETINCSKCGKELRLLKSFLGDIPDMDTYFGNVCMACKRVYCSECIEVGKSTPCPECGTPTDPALRKNLREIGLLTEPILLTLDVEAESLDEAREKVKSQIPEGLILISEKIISDGNPTTVEASAVDFEWAFKKAQQEFIPAGASILDQKEITMPGRKVILVEANDEQTARTQAKNQIGKTELFESIHLKTSGKAGFLGVGKKPNQYECEIQQLAVVNVTYIAKPRISARIGKSFQGKLEDLQSEYDVRRELMNLGLSEEEAFAAVAVGSVIVSRLDPVTYQMILKDKGPITCDDLAMKWFINRLEKEKMQRMIDEILRKK